MRLRLASLSRFVKGLVLVCALFTVAHAQERNGAAVEAQTQPTPAAAVKAADEGERLTFMQEEGGALSSEAPSAAGLLVRTLGALLLIVGLIVAVGWVLRRVGGARFGAPRRDGPELTLMTTVSLGDKRALSVVRFGRRTLLVGSTAQAVTLIAEDEEQDIPAEFIARPVSALLLEADSNDTFESHLLEATTRS